MYVYMYVCMYVCIYALYVYIYALYVCIHVCMYEGGGGMYSCPTTTNRDGTFQKKKCWGII